jgi:hypothetical protein
MKLKVHVYYSSKRYETNAVLSKIEPEFNESFEFGWDPDSIVHVCVVRLDSDGGVFLVGVSTIDWGHVVDRHDAVLELTDVGNSSITVGLLQINLEFHTKNTLAELKFHIQEKKARDMESSIIFFEYIKQV